MDYALASQFVLWIGVAALALGLVSDWAKSRYIQFRRGVRRRRCPKCWYDLSHTPGLICNECGYTARRERAFHKSRRRWKFIWLAIVIFIGSHAINVTPAVRDRGWPAAVPTTALIVALPVLRLSLDNFEAVIRFGGAQPTAPTDLTWRDQCYGDLLQRVDQGLSRWQQLTVSAICRRIDQFDETEESYWNSPRDELLGCTR